MALDLWSTPAVFFLLEEVLRFSGILHLTAPCTRLGARLGTTLGEHRPNAGRKHRQHGADNQIKAIRKIIEVGITWYNQYVMMIVVAKICKNGSSEVKDSHGQESAVCLRFSHDFLQVGRQFQNENLQSPI
jgi:hypothetical protein